MKKLSWYELVPLVSFLAQRGRCIGCKSKISIQYPLVELAAGLVFAGVFFRLQDLFFINPAAFVPSYAYYAFMFSILLIIAVYDYKHKIVPDKLSLLLGVLAFAGLFLFWEGVFFLHMPGIKDFLAGFVLALPFALLWLLSRGAWMGLGDAKLAVGLGWLSGLSAILSGAALSFWLGAVVGLTLIFSRKKYSLKTEIPFAPFLALGTFLAFIFRLDFFPGLY